MIIINFAIKNEWETESNQGFYGNSYLNEKQYIPCYKIADISNIKLNYSTLKDYVILCIDENKVTSEIKYEKQENSDFLEPNIYGLINKDAVIAGIEVLKPEEVNKMIVLHDEITSLLEQNLLYRKVFLIKKYFMQTL